MLQRLALCRAKPSLLAFVLAHGLSEADSGWAEIEKALEDAVAEQSARPNPQLAKFIQAYGLGAYRPPGTGASP